MRNKSSNGLLLFVGLVLCVPALVWGAARWWAHFTATRDCLAYVDRAAHAPTLDVCDSSLATAVEAADRWGWTKGNTGIVWEQTTNDVGFWYSNLLACRADLAAARKSGDQLTASNTLMRVRETLSRIPDGIAVFPNQTAWAVSGWVLGILAVVGALIFLVGLEA